MTKEELKRIKDSLLKLRTRLGEAHEIGWFHNLERKVDYKSDEARKEVQDKLDHAMGGLSIVYLFAIFESYFKREHWKKFIKEDEIKILKAYRHVRHSIAHQSGGLRVRPRKMEGWGKEEYDAFDEMIEKEYFGPKKLISLESSSERMIIRPTVGEALKSFMDTLAQSAIAEVCKQIKDDKKDFLNRN